MGYKFAIYNKKIIIKLGYSHRILIKEIKNVLMCYKAKQLLLLKSRNLGELSKLMFSLKLLRKVSSYKKKGVFLKGFIIKLKTSNKKSKF